MNTNLSHVPIEKPNNLDASLTIQAELINAPTFAKMLSISERTLYRLKSTGELPNAVVLGGSVRWRLAEVREWISKGCPARSTNK